MTRAIAALLLLIACAEQPVPAQPAPENAAAPAPAPFAPPPPPPPAPDAAPRPVVALSDGMLEVSLRSSSIKVKGKTLSLSGLTKLFERIAAQDPEAQVLVRVEGTVAKSRIAQVMTAAEGAGLSRIGTMDVGGSGPTKKKRKRR